MDETFFQLPCGWCGKWIRLTRGFALYRELMPTKGGSTLMALAHEHCAIEAVETGRRRLVGKWTYEQRERAAT